MKTVLTFTVRGNGIATFQREYRAFIRDLKAVDGKTFTYRLNFESPSAASMSQFREIPRPILAEGLKRAHRDTKPQIYSDRLAGGGPFRQRVDAMANYLASVPTKDVIRTRREGQLKFAEADGRIFKPDTGRLGRAVSSATRVNLDRSLDKMFGMKTR